MAGTTGVVQAAMVGGSYNTPVGIVTGGTWGEDTQAVVRTGIGGVGTWKAGAALPTVSGLTYFPVDTNALTDEVCRATYPNGTHSSCYLKVGDSEKSIAGTAWYVNRTDISCEVDGAVQMTQDLLLFGKPTISTGVEVPTTPKTVYTWYNGECQVGGANKGIRAFKLSVDNAYQAFYSMNSKTDGSYRYPEYGVQGAEKVELSLQFLAWPTMDLSDDVITTLGTVVLRMVNDATSAKTLTVTVATPKIISWQSGVVDNDTLLTYDAVLRLDYNSGVTITNA